MQLTKKIIFIVAMAAFALNLTAQEKKEKKVKDQAEYDLFQQITGSIGNAAGAAARLQNLEKWKAGYAETDFADIRRKAYLITYQQMANHKAVVEAAQDILKSDDPNDLQALSAILGSGLAAQPPAFEAVQKTAEYVVNNVDTIYGADKKPQGVTDEQWNAGKPVMKNFAQYTLANSYVVQKNNDKAEPELLKTLQGDPTNARASYALAGILLAQQQKAPEKMPLALFEYARAANYDGPNSMPAQNRAQIGTFFDKAYATFHGSADGAADVKTLAKANALPPADFHIKSVVQIAEEKEKERQEKLGKDPMGGFWNEIKENLLGGDSEKYWAAMDGAGLPGGQNGVNKFEGKLFEAKPATRPKELVMAVAGDTPNVTLKFDDPLPGTMEPGGMIKFSGTAKAFAKDPYMLTFETQMEDIEGWTGKGPARAPGAGKKGGPAPATKGGAAPAGKKQ